MANFDLNAILRGAQLTIVGAHRALKNPGLLKSEHYKHAVMAVAVGILINGILEIPVLLARGGIYSASFFTTVEVGTWDNTVIDILSFLQHSVLQLPFFMMNLMKFLTPALDDVFMESLDFVDKTYTQKHAGEKTSTLRAMYYPNLAQYTSSLPPKTKSLKKTPWEGISNFLLRYGRKAAFSVAIYMLSFSPVVGKLVLPAVSFYYFDKSVGPVPAVAIFASGLVVPKRYLVKFLQAYFSSRSMMRELAALYVSLTEPQLEPYFSRIHFSGPQKAAWFYDREGVLFGFGLAFFLLIKIPIFGVLVYGIAEASTAYLITKITEPPPTPESGMKEQFVESEKKWRNKKGFLEGKLDGLDSGRDPLVKETAVGGGGDMPRKRFT